MTLISRLIYIYESSNGDSQVFDPLINQHDYSNLFLKYDYYVIKEGSHISESGNLQRWVHFGNIRNIDG